MKLHEYNHLDWILIAAMVLLALLLLGLSARAQEPNKFWTNQQIAWESANFAAGAVDVAISCNHLRQGWVEVTAPTQSCAGVAGWVLGSKAAGLGASYFLWKSGHQRLALAVPKIMASGSGIAITYDLWPRTSHRCATNQPCERR